MKWTLTITSGFNDGKTVTRKPKETKEYTGKFEDVCKKIQEEYFTDGDNVERDNYYGKTGYNEWYLIRKIGNGEFRAIYRLRPYEEEDV